MFKLQRKTAAVTLPSGIKCTVGELLAGHQGVLTQKGAKAADKMNKLLADLIIDIDGYEWASMGIPERIKAVRGMLSGDRKYILTESRQLSMGYPESFKLYMETKNTAGVKSTTEIDVKLISESNLDDILNSIGHEDKARVTEINHTGGFPSRPYKERFSRYPLDVDEIEPVLSDIVQGYDIKFRLLTGQTEETFNSQSDSNTRLLARLLRYREHGQKNAAWHRFTSEDIATLPIGVSDKIISVISEYEGDVDTVEIRENAEGEKMIVELTSEISFFFPSGKI